MLKYAPENLYPGTGGIRLECQLDGTGAEKSYVVGDHLQGTLFLTASKDCTLDCVIGHLDFRVRSDGKTSSSRGFDFTISESINLRAGETRTLGFRADLPFHRAAYYGRELRAYWRLGVDIHLRGKATNLLRSSLDKVLGERTKVSAEYRVPVVKGKGHYRVQPAAFRLRTTSDKMLTFPSLVIIMLAFIAFSSTNPDAAAMVYALHLAGLAFALVVVLTKLITLDVFPFRAINVEPRRDGALRVRFPDMGKEQYDRLVIGYRLLAYSPVNIDGTMRESTKVLHDINYLASSLSRAGGLFREAVLPWPQAKDLPASLEHKGEGYRWELYLRADAFPFGPQEQAWPIEVDWVSLGIPAPAELREELELKPLEPEAPAEPQESPFTKRRK